MQRAVFSDPAGKYILAGRVEKAQGLKGAIYFRPLSRQPENFCTYRQIALADEHGQDIRVIAVLRSRRCREGVALELDGFTTRTQAEQIVGSFILIEKAALPVLQEFEYYWYQIVGLPVITTEGKSIGTVSRLFSNGSHDVAVINQGKKEIFIPLVRSIVVQQSDNELIIDPPQGLLEINGQEERDEDIFL